MSEEVCRYAVPHPLCINAPLWNGEQLGKNQNSHITARDCYCQSRHKDTGVQWQLMMWEHSLEGRWAYQPLFADLISKPWALHQKLAFESTAGRSPLADCEVAEKVYSSPLLSECDKHIRM